MQDFSALDPDEHALTRRPRPIGWFVAGVLGIGGLALGLGYYLPLASAHERLAHEHEALAKKSAELNQALGAARTELEKTEKERASLRSAAETAEKSAASDASRFDQAAALAGQQLAKFVQAKVLTVSSTAHGMTLAVNPGPLFVGATTGVAPAWRKPLCSAVESVVRKSDLRLQVLIPTEKPDDAAAWEKATARAAALGTILEQMCKVPATRLVVGARGGADGGKDRVEFLVESTAL